MGRLQNKRSAATLRKDRIRNRVKSHEDRLRLSVKVSNKNISVQAIDDTSGKTVFSVSNTKMANLSGSMTEKAKAVGSEVAKQAKAKKVKRVVLDRNGKLYHGRIKALAEAAREGGLEF